MSNTYINLAERIAQALRGTLPSGAKPYDFSIRGHVLPNGEVKVGKLDQKPWRSVMPPESLSSN